MNISKLRLALPLVAVLAGCTTGGKIQTAPVNLNGVTGVAIRIPQTGDTPGLTGLAVPNGRPGGMNVAAVGGDGYKAKVIEALGRVAGGLAGGAIGGGARASASVIANAVAINGGP